MHAPAVQPDADRWRCITGLLPHVSIGVVDHLDALRGEGAAFVGVLHQADAGLPVPVCGEWRLRDLAHHLGGVHRWATSAALGEGRAPSVLARPVPPDEELADWLLEGLEALTVALTDEERPCWTLTGHATATWWRRRQALETAVHRVDAERVLGPANPIDPALAADGIAEVVDVLHPRQIRLGRAALPAASLRLTTDDGQGSWLVAGPSPAAEIIGPAETLLLLVWGRTNLDDRRLQVEGLRLAQVVLAEPLTP